MPTRALVGRTVVEKWSTSCLVFGMLFFFPGVVVTTLSYLTDSSFFEEQANVVMKVIGIASVSIGLVLLIAGTILWFLSPKLITLSRENETSHQSHEESNYNQETPPPQYNIYAQFNHPLYDPVAYSQSINNPEHNSCLSSVSCMEASYHEQENPNYFIYHSQDNPESPPPTYEEVRHFPKTT